MDFDDESRIELAAHSSARVLQKAPATVHVLLEKGQAEIQVTPARQTDWLLEAGPYTVRVTGTRFTLAWSQVENRFTLALHEGSVAVTGPLLAPGTRVAAGQRMVADLFGGRIEIARVAERETDPGTMRTDVTGASPGTAVRERKPNHRRAGRAVAADKAQPSPEDGGTWRQLCRQAEFGEVVAQAKERGLHATLQSGNREDLSALGEAARLTRERTIAHDTYLSLRQRFPGTQEATTAAFYLGKMAFDQRRAFSAAAGWFEAYLNEAPAGRFSTDALGRLIEARQRSGNTAGAKEAARAYLSRHPDGTHAAVAREILAPQD